MPLARRVSSSCSRCVVGATVGAGVTARARQRCAASARIVALGLSPKLSSPSRSSSNSSARCLRTAGRGRRSNRRVRRAWLSTTKRTRARSANSAAIAPARMTSVVVVHRAYSFRLVDSLRPPGHRMSPWRRPVAGPEPLSGAGHVDFERLVDRSGHRVGHVRATGRAADLVRAAVLGGVGACRWCRRRPTPHR